MTTKQRVPSSREHMNRMLERISGGATYLRDHAEHMTASDRASMLRDVLNDVASALQWNALTEREEGA